MRPNWQVFLLWLIWLRSESSTFSSSILIESNQPFGPVLTGNPKLATHVLRAVMQTGQWWTCGERVLYCRTGTSLGLRIALLGTGRTEKFPSSSCRMLQGYFIIGLFMNYIGTWIRYSIPYRKWKTVVAWKLPVLGVPDFWMNTADVHTIYTHNAYHHSESTKVANRRPNLSVSPC